MHALPSRLRVVGGRCRGLRYRLVGSARDVAVLVTIAKQSRDQENEGSRDEEAEAQAKEDSDEMKGPGSDCKVLEDRHRLSHCPYLSRIQQFSGFRLTESLRRRDSGSRLIINKLSPISSGSGTCDRGHQHSYRTFDHYYYPLSEYYSMHCDMQTRASIALRALCPQLNARNASIRVTERVKIQMAPIAGLNIRIRHRRGFTFLALSIMSCVGHMHIQFAALQ